LPSIPGIENLSPAVRYLLAFAIIFMLLALFALVLRRLTGARLTLASDRGRARQPRLGIVDVYDLDRHRQLILLRRDNVEHLLLVGGPNDVVVETNIVRVPGARLPASAPEVTERLEAAAAERPPEIAPVRPVVEPPPVRPAAARPAEPVVAGHLGRAETVAAAPAAPLRPAMARAEAPVRPVPAPAAPAPAPQRSPDRSRATPVPPAAQLGGAAARAPAPGPRNAPPAAAAPREPEPAPTRPGLSDMARQLEDVLKRPEAPAPARPAPEPVREAPPSRPQPTLGPRAEPRPTQRPEPSAPAPQDEDNAAAPAGATGPAEPTPPPQPEKPRASAQPTPAPAAVPAPPPPPAPEPPRLVEAPPPAPPEPPPQTSPRPDPFSIEDIEAEFARLLGRPLDRKDGKS
jgi:hypothetical protein